MVKLQSIVFKLPSVVTYKRRLLRLERSEHAKDAGSMGVVYV